MVQQETEPRFSRRQVMSGLGIGVGGFYCSSFSTVIALFAEQRVNSGSVLSVRDRRRRDNKILSVKTWWLVGLGLGWAVTAAGSAIAADGLINYDTNADSRLKSH